MEDLVLKVIRMENKRDKHHDKLYKKLKERTEKYRRKKGAKTRVKKDRNVTADDIWGDSWAEQMLAEGGLKCKSKRRK